MKKLQLGAVALLVAMFVSGSAHAEDPVVKFERYKLDNGLEVILHQDKRVPLVAVNVWYHVGSGDELPGKSGFAHLFEHMLFQGSEHVGSDNHFAILQQIGATGVNGTTNFDRTNYFEIVPSNQIEVGLWLESDRMGYLLPMLDKKSLDNQIEVVRNERRQRVDNVPYGRTYLKVFETLYPEGHPYRYTVIGDHADLASANIEDVKNFYRRWYAPANATLVVAGDFELDDAKKLVNKWFGTFPKSTRPVGKAPKTPIISATERVEISDPLAKLTEVQYVWHSPKLYADGDAELDILADALTRTGTGRLYKILVHEKQLAQSVSANQSSKGYSSTFHITARIKTGVDPAVVEKIINQELEGVRREAVSQREFDRAVTAREASMVWRLESLNARANLLQGYNHFLEKPDAISWDLDRYRKTTPEKVRATAARYLGRQNRIEVITVPAASAAPKPVPAAK